MENEGIRGCGEVAVVVVKLQLGRNYEVVEKVATARPTEEPEDGGEELI